MSSFFEVMLIILIRRSLFTAEFIRASFQSSRWFKIYTKFRVESLWGEAINCSTLDQKVWQFCRQWIPGAVSSHPSWAQAAACGHLILALLSHYQTSCQAEEGTVPKHLHLSLNPPQTPRNILQCSVSYNWEHCYQP